MNRKDKVSLQSLSWNRAAGFEVFCDLRVWNFTPRIADSDLRRRCDRNSSGRKPVRQLLIKHLEGLGKFLDFLRAHSSFSHFTSLRSSRKSSGSTPAIWRAINSNLGWLLGARINFIYNKFCSSSLVMNFIWFTADLTQFLFLRPLTFFFSI